MTDETHAIGHADRSGQKQKHPATHTARRVIFALTPLLVVAMAATFVLSALERREVIVTERPDDSVSHAPVHLLRKIATDAGEMYQVKAYNMDLSTIPVQKASDARRVLVSGESFAQALAHWIEATLKARCPTRRLEVINGGAGGRNPEAVVGVTEKLFELDPDVLVVAMGNNQGLPNGAKVNDVLHRWVVYRQLKRAVLPVPELNERPYLMVQDRDADAARISFERSLRSMVRYARAHHARTVLCTLPVNLRYFEARLVPNEPILRQSQNLFAQGRFRQAINTVSASPEQAWAAKLIGDCLRALGEYGHAQTAYQISVEMNPLGRMRPTLNETVREICRAENLPLVDLERTAERLSPDGIPDPALFIDNCHLTNRGYLLMAREILHVLLREELLGVGDDETPPPAWESALDAAAGL